MTGRLHNADKSGDTQQRTNWTRAMWRRNDTWPHPQYLTDRTPLTDDEDTDNDD